MPYILIICSLFSGLFLFVRLTVCLNLTAIRLSSIVDSVSVVSVSSTSRSERSSPVRWISPFCLALSGSLCMASMLRVSSRSFVNESIIAMVVCVALGLFRMVASIYSPPSVNALGSTGDFSGSPCGRNFRLHTVSQILSDKSSIFRETCLGCSLQLHLPVLFPLRRVRQRPGQV